VDDARRGRPLTAVRSTSRAREPAGTAATDGGRIYRMAWPSDAATAPRSERGWAQAPPDVIVLVLLGALAVALVTAGTAGDGSSGALAAGSLAGAASLLLLARRSMELFVLVVLGLRPVLDGLHAGGRSAATDPAIVVALVFAGVSVVWLVSRRLSGRRHPASFAELMLVAFVTAAALATIGSEAPVHSLGELGRLVAAALMFVVVDRVCEDTGRPDRVVLAVLAAAVIPVGVALLGPLVGLHRTEVKDQIQRAVSTFAQSNPFGHFLTLIVLVLAAYVFVGPARWRRNALIAGVPVALCLALSYTRLAWVAAIIGLLVMAWVARRRWLVPTILALVAVFTLTSPSLGHRLDQLTSANAAVSGSESGLDWRLGHWVDVAKLTGRNPITGIGPNVAARRVADHQPPHNDYLRALVELGIVGFVAYVGLVVALVGVAVGAQRRADGLEARIVALAFVGVVTAFVASSFAANILGQVVLLWYVFALAAAAAWVARHGVVRTARPEALVFQ
jgi:O-antigen ligase